MASIRVPLLFVIQFTFNRCFSPAEIGLDHSDHRKLAVFFRMLRISANNGESIECDFSNSEVLRKHALFGFWQPESGGVWSAGGRSALFFEGNLGSSRSLQLKLEAHPFAEAFAENGVEIKTSTGHYAVLNITTTGSVAVHLARPFLFPKTRLVTGDLRLAIVDGNVSNLRRNPKISLIILNLNKPLLSRLSAIAAASSQIPVPFEILCVDNGSDPKSLAKLHAPELPMRFVMIGENKGFGVANNRAAEEAQGEYVLFLNNDAFLKPHAVREMLAAFETHSDCAAVGPVLRYPDETLQEAGCSIQPDGHPLRHGRGDANFNLQPLPRFAPVDYVSGACLMMRRSEFLEIGGFDPVFSPAYYEDTDLCIRLATKGKKVYLASRSTCYHIENATSHSVESAEWATSQAEKNRLIFLERWAQQLLQK
jgi:GT2 family glycosyltransferase